MNTQTWLELQEATLSAASSIIEVAWEELRRSPSVLRQLGVAPVRLPAVSFAEVQRRSVVGRSLLMRLDALDTELLPHDVVLTLRLVRFRAINWSREEEWYWTVIDPLGLGFFGLFAPTAYCGGLLLDTVHGDLAAFSFTEPGDMDRYLALIADYSRLVDQFAERTAGQAQRGMRMPKLQVLQARALLAAFKSGVRDALAVSPQRLEATTTNGFARELEHRIATCIEPAFDRAIEGLSDAYLALAPDTVGLGQYREGAEIYAELVKLHTTLNLTPEQVHALGLERMADIETQMRGIRSAVGFQGDGAAFLAHLREDSRWRANSVEAVKGVFQRYIDRLKPHFKDYFANEPTAGCGVEPLPEALEGSMTFGYYDEPHKGRTTGLYFFNAKNLTKQALVNIGSLTYHELMPGHHLHLATQHENKELHPFRAHSFVNAYNEGWAEYAATLAGEIGLYEQPEERYGRLMMDAFLTCRLVVDTAMNVLGWPLERACKYMRTHSGMAEAEILSESLRYSCDLPGQSLAYKLGDTKILSLRQRMRSALGARFGHKLFHSTILRTGALPLRDLEWHVDCEIDRLKSGH